MIVANSAIHDASAAWIAPDMTLLLAERSPVPVLDDKDFDLIFGEWADWLRVAAQVKGVPVDYIILALLTTASACIGNARWAGPWSGWKEPPILWGMLVGDPSAGKSPALDAVLDPVKEIEREMADLFKVKRAKWEDESEIASMIFAQWKKDSKKAVADGNELPEKPQAAYIAPSPVRERITIADATIEKAAELLSAHWRGLLLTRDELSGWIGGMDRYKPGGDRSFWLESYGGRPYPVDRKSNPEPIIVDRLSVAVLGGTQPAKLDRLLVKTDDDGLLARFMIVFPDPAPLSRPTGLIDEARLKAALRRLHELAPAKDENGNLAPVLLPFTEQAANVLQEFRKECRQWETQASSLFKGHIGKFPGLAVRIACALAHLDWVGQPEGTAPTQIETKHIGRACHLVGEHLRLHAFRAYGAAAGPDDVRNARKLARRIWEGHHSEVTVRQIQRWDNIGMDRSSVVEAAVCVLEDANWLRQVKEQTAGRPRIYFHVNPRIWEAK